MTLIAFDTATERLSIGLLHGGRAWLHEEAGGARASVAIVPRLLALLADAGATLADLDAIAFGRGPGAFTGLRTACAVAQGLALGTGRPVLALDSLLAVAEDARAGAPALQLWVAVDARMDEVYAAEYAHAEGAWRTVREPMLLGVEALAAMWREAPPACVAGDALTAFASRLVPGTAVLCPEARPRARALLTLAEAAWRAGRTLDAASALPLYVRDRVASTIAEREASRAARDEAERLARAGAAATLHTALS